jgi:RNA ligase
LEEKSMKYAFPKITHIDDVKPAIEGRDEFIIAERDWGFAVNYMVSLSDSFPPVNTVTLTNGDADIGDLYETKADLYAAIRRECRGLLFYPDGTIMSRRYHKFFNCGEKDETQLHLIDLSEPHVILEKLDGSMITPVFVGDTVKFGTKMGVTDVATQVEEFVSANQQYVKFALECKEVGVTPIFEWCSRKQKIVIDYPNDMLVLTAMRNTVSGDYMPYNQLKTLGAKYGIPVVGAFNGTAHSIESLIAHTTDLQGQEGYIIRFNSGHMLKLKAAEYLRFHKTKDGLSLEKNVIDMLVNETLDDAKAFMQDEDRKRIEEFEDKFWHGINNTVVKYGNYWETVCNTIDKKTWAINHMPKMKAADQYIAPVMFSKYDGKDIRTSVLNIIKKHTNTASMVESVRPLWENAKWTYHYNGEA